MKKILLILLAVGVLGLLLIIGVVWYGVSQIDNLVKLGIERGGTYATGVETTADGVDVGLTSGTFSMTGFTLANPDGFDSSHFLSMGGTDLQLDTASITSDTIVVPSLTLSSIDVILDKGGSPSNYQTILDNLKRFESGDSAEPAESSGGPKVVINSLVIDGVDVHLANMPGLSIVASEVAVKVPRIELQNVGADEPMGAGEIVSLIVKTVLAASIEAGGGIIPTDVLGDLSGSLSQLTSLSDLGIDAVGDLGAAIEEQLGGSIQDVLDQGQGVVDDLSEQGEAIQDEVEGVIDDAEDAIEGVKGIFGGNKDEP